MDLHLTGQTFAVLPPVSSFSVLGGSLETQHHHLSTREHNSQHANNSRLLETRGQQYIPAVADDGMVFIESSSARMRSSCCDSETASGGYSVSAGEATTDATPPSVNKRAQFKLLVHEKVMEAVKLASRPGPAIHTCRC